MSPLVIPPIKIQGIKTKLLPLIQENMVWDKKGKWIEPFLGSGVVLFNVNPAQAIVCDTNKHIINFYVALQTNQINEERVREYLNYEGHQLEHRGESHYYDIRSRFNLHGDPLDFLFVNRACFNGLMRFNRKREFNTPFCRKSRRYSKAYITKICNQVRRVSQRMKGKDWTFVCSDWSNILTLVHKEDFIYADPPYIDRFSDYFNSWKQDDAIKLETFLKEKRAKFIYSMWLENKYRTNTRLLYSFDKFKVVKYEHYYHLGASEQLRNSMTEGLVCG